MNTLSGIGASPGIGVGPLVELSRSVGEIGDIADPENAVQSAMKEVGVDLAAKATKAEDLGREEAAAVLRAQALMAEDPMLADAIGDQLNAGQSLDDALNTASNELQAMLASLPDPYLASRAADVGEVATALRRKLAGEDDSGAQLTEPSVLCAPNLTAAETADLDPAEVLGFVTEEGGPTGHVAIIARSLGVPAVVGVRDLMNEIGDAATIAIDGSTGEVVTDPDGDQTAEFESRAARLAQAAERAAEFKGQTAKFGSHTMLVAANVGGPADIDNAVEFDADGVGLFRTEFLFLDRAEPPTEDEQFDLYRKAAEQCRGQVVIRTFDIGGDKPADFISFDAEENPFLGMRGVRIYETFPDLFESQINAALRAAEYGDVALMIPMVASASEFRQVHERITSIGDIPVGVMVEVPSIALTAASIADQAAFFSIGTNDLTQYTMAADRTHGLLGSYQDPLHPAVVKLCRETVVGASHGSGKVSVCGEAASDPVAACVYAAIGIEKLSVTPSAVNLIKWIVSQQSPDLVEVVATAIESSATAAEFRDAVKANIVGL